MAMTEDEKTEKKDAWTAELNLDLEVPSLPIVSKLFCEPFEICIKLPWGISFCTGIDIDFPDCKAWIEKILGPLNALLGSIQPIFLIVDVILAIQECILAIPQSILSLSPQPLLDCVENLIAAILALLCALYPPFAWPALILSVVDFLLQVITCIKDTVQALCDALDRITNLDNLIAGDSDLEGTTNPLSGLSALLDAAKFNIGCQANSALGGIANLCSLIEIINNFIAIANELAGEEIMPTIPCPDVELNIPCIEILAILEGIESVLLTFDAIFPDCPPE